MKRVLRVDPIKCDGYGICAHLAPDVISVDPWGYPVLDDVDVTGDKRAARAVKGCPKGALYIHTEYTSK